ncbi:MAG: YqaA family protein [Sphaerochaeta sp.]|jgi:membrane protein YqaA with SNARE-associated domain|uniref:YqaA family protein n=1 Tax=Sphaerochaeta sp. TaxID=1972642 RepID=UPI002FCCB843
MKLRQWLQVLFSKETYLKEDGTLNVRKLLFRTLLAMVCIFSLYFIAFQYYKSLGLDKNALIQQFIDNFGIFGVALYVYLVDLVVAPLSVDFIWPFVMHWPPLQAIFVMGTASVAGAFTAYLFGRLVGLIPMFRHWVLKQSGTHTQQLITRYGLWAIVISGLTPLPFSTICIVAGILELKAPYVLAASTIRYARMGLYYLIFSGLLGIA